MRDHRRLKAFDLADQLALETYRLTKSFPKEEVYGLIAQMRRAAVSISSNMVEGCGRDSRAERFGYFGKEEGSAFLGKLDECEKVLAALIRSVRES